MHDVFWFGLAAYALWLFAEGLVCFWDFFRGNFYDEKE